MRNLLDRLKNIAPDIAATFFRFILPIIFLALTTVIVIALTNDFIRDSEDFFAKLAFGCATAFIFSLAGRLYNESKSNNIFTIIILELLIPIAVVFAMQVENYQYIVPFILPVLGVLWLSVSAFTKIGKGKERDDIQGRFWIINHRAFVSAIIAFVGFLIIALGLFAIERSLSLLFGLKISNIFYEYLFPFAGLFLAPFFWLSTIPKLNEISAKELETPDFLSKAIGFLGQFLFVPFLFVYALILLSYGVQIIFSREFPVGTISWMVLGFTITGAIAWLLIYPNFMRQKKLVRIFRSCWFYLTIIPLILFVIGVYIRIDAYGLTSFRMLLIAGGIWAFLLTILFLSKKFADIRLMPFLAGLLLLLLSVGPFNLINAPLLNQAARLDASINSALGENGIKWNEESAKTAKGTIDYLYKEDGEKYIERIFEQHKIDYSSSSSRSELYKILKIDEFTLAEQEVKNRNFNSLNNIYPNVSSTPYYLGNVNIYRYASLPIPVANISFKLAKQTIIIYQNQNTDAKITVDLSEWILEQKNDEISNPKITFKLENIDYILLVSNLSLNKLESGEWTITVLESLLFSSKMPKANL